MGNEWRESTWGQEISLEYGKRLTDYKHGEGNYQVFGANGPVGWTTEPLTSGPGIILGRKGANRGVEYSKEPFYVIDTAYYVKPKKNLDMRWVYYAIKYYNLGEINDGSPIPSTTRSAVYVCPLNVPDIYEQKAIAHILGSLDDKIELSRRMNETLEAMAQAMFKSWFVDFDPVIDNALAAGNEIPEELQEKAAVRESLGDKRKPLPQEISRLFPSEFEHSEEMGWIPKGWEIKSMNQLLRSVSETYPLKKVDEVVFLNTGDILNGKFLHKNYSSVKGLPGQAKKSIRKNDILYSEIRPINKRFAFVHFNAEEYVVSTKLMVLREISEIKSIFAYLILKQESVINYLQMMAESRSGTFPQITFDVLSTIQVVLPESPKIIEYFTENILEPMYEKTIKNDIFTEELTVTRDTLLPKLLSGQLRIPEAEKLAEAL